METEDHHFHYFLVLNNINEQNVLFFCSCNRLSYFCWCCFYFLCGEYKLFRFQNCCFLTNLGSSCSLAHGASSLPLHALQSFAWDPTSSRPNTPPFLKLFSTWWKILILFIKLCCTIYKISFISYSVNDDLSRYIALPLLYFPFSIGGIYLEETSCWKLISVAKC